MQESFPARIWDVLHCVAVLNTLCLVSYPVSQTHLISRIFFLDCIGSAFNAKGVMQCPNCRKVEKGQWLYANGCRSHPEFNVEDWVHEEEIYDIGSYPEMVKTLSLPKLSYVTLLCPTCLSCVPRSKTLVFMLSLQAFGVHWCPFGSSARLPSFESVIKNSIFWYLLESSLLMNESLLNFVGMETFRRVHVRSFFSPFVLVY